MPIQESLHRIKKLLENPEKMQNIKEIFYEAAIDSPEMLQGNTHLQGHGRICLGSKRQRI